jgi:hypothetical protein
MIIKSSDQVPRITLLKRFPVPRNFGVASESRIERGQTWPAPAGARRVKTFEVYRYDLDSGCNPRLDTFEVDLDDCGPMLAMGDMDPTCPETVEAWPGASCGQPVAGAGLMMRPQVDLLPQMFCRNPSNCRICE